VLQNLTQLFHLDIVSYALFNFVAELLLVFKQLVLHLVKLLDWTVREGSLKDGLPHRGNLEFQAFVVVLCRSPSLHHFLDPGFLSGFLLQPFFLPLLIAQAFCLQALFDQCLCLLGLFLPHAEVLLGELVVRLLASVCECLDLLLALKLVLNEGRPIRGLLGELWGGSCFNVACLVLELFQALQLLFER